MMTEKEYEAFMYELLKQLFIFAPDRYEYVAKLINEGHDLAMKRKARTSNE